MRKSDTDWLVDITRFGCLAFFEFPLVMEQFLSVSSLTKFLKMSIQTNQFNLITENINNKKKPISYTLVILFYFLVDFLFLFKSEAQFFIVKYWNNFIVICSTLSVYYHITINPMKKIVSMTQCLGHRFITFSYFCFILVSLCKCILVAQFMYFQYWRKRPFWKKKMSKIQCKHWSNFVSD